MTVITIDIEDEYCPNKFLEVFSFLSFPARSVMGQSLTQLYLLSTYYVPGTVFGAGNTAVK